MSPRHRIVWTVAAIVGLGLLSWHSLNAGAAAEPTVRAAFKNDVLLVAVDATGEAPRKLAGPVTVELLDKGVSVAKETLAEPKASRDFQFKVAPKDKDRLTLKVTHDGQTKETPLGANRMV